MRYYRYDFNAMGTPCDIQLFAVSPEYAKNVANAVIAEVQRLEARYSRYKTDSFLSEINRVAAQGGSIVVDAETANLLDYADTCYQQSEGLFDITSGILRQAWHFKDASASLPNAQHIKNLLARVGWQQVVWQRPELSFPLAGIELDFGGIVKEYAVDRCAALCLAQGIHHAVINLGGDIKVIGARYDGEPWRIGIRHPRHRNSVLNTLELHSGALASSGDYERCFIVEGVRYGHILNPQTGWPVRYLAAVSVVADFCVVAGSASTIALLKAEQGAAWLADLGLPHVWVDVDGNVGGTFN